MPFISVVSFKKDKVLYFPCHWTIHWFQMWTICRFPIENKEKSCFFANLATNQNLFFVLMVAIIFFSVKFCKAIKPIAFGCHKQLGSIHAWHFLLFLWLHGKWLKPRSLWWRLDRKDLVIFVTLLLGTHDHIAPPWQPSKMSYHFMTNCLYSNRLTFAVPMCLC